MPRRSSAPSVWLVVGQAGWSFNEVHTTSAVATRIMRIAATSIDFLVVGSTSNDQRNSVRVQRRHDHRLFVPQRG